MVTVRAYDPDDDRDRLWALKHAFETSLGDTGDSGKASAYADKLSPEYRANYLDWVDFCIDAAPACLQVAVDDDTGVGYSFVLPEDLAYIWDGAVLNELYVDPQYRGTGVADRLLDTALDVVDDQDLPMNRLLLDVDPDNERARRFYERHGFESWGTMLVLDR